MPFLDLKKTLADAIAAYLKQPGAEPHAIEAEFGVPPTPDLGHLAYPCFRLAKILKRAPNQLASDFAAHVKVQGVEVKATGPYVNFRQDPLDFCRGTLDRIFSQADRYGSDSSGEKNSVVIEYCSPNIAKPLAFQHIRSTLIGSTLANVYQYFNYTTVRINFVGDWGSQFARLVAAVNLWGRPEKLSLADIDSSMKELFGLYVRFHQELEKDESLADRAAEALQRLETHDAKTVQLWKLVRDISVASMEKTLRRMNVSFDHVEGESKYIAAISEALAQIKKKAGARLSEGAYVVDVPGIETPALVQKSDGTTLYLTRDIAAAIDRFQRFHFEKMLYVVSEQQKLHFRQLFGVIKKMGYDWADGCEHLSFGTVLFESGKMSTRKGQVVFLDDLLDEAGKLALAEVMQKNPDLKNKEEVAEMVGVGAVVFGELSTHRSRDFQFNWKEVLALDGETGPYVQYALVRCHSLLDKARQKSMAGFQLSDLPSRYVFSPEEESLVLQLAKLRSTLYQVIRENEPFYLARYLIDLSKAFSRFYYQHPVLQAENPSEQKLRMGLVLATRQVLTNGLRLLGIACPREM